MTKYSCPYERLCSENFTSKCTKGELFSKLELTQCEHIMTLPNFSIIIQTKSSHKTFYMVGKVLKTSMTSHSTKGLACLWIHINIRFNNAHNKSVRVKSRLRDTITQTWYYHVCVILRITKYHADVILHFSHSL